MKTVERHAGGHLFFAALLLLIGGAASAQDGPGLHEGDFFGAGSQVVLAQPVEGDALLAGANVESNASISGDASLAGLNVAVRATIGEDLYVAGGRVEVDALVAGSARIAGGRVRIRRASRIEDGTAIAGTNVKAQGHFGNYLNIAGNDVTLGGHIEGDVHVFAERLTVLAGTRIDGALHYRVTRQADIAADLETGAGVHPEEPGQGVLRLVPGLLRGLGWVWITGLFITGLLLVTVFSGFSRRSTAVLAGHPLSALVAGLLVFIGLPGLALVFAITIAGLPLAVLVAIMYLLMLVVGYVTGALYLGDRLLAKLGRQAAERSGWRLLLLLLVLTVLALLASVPWLGNLLRFIVLLLGLGGLVLAQRADVLSGKGRSAIPAPPGRG